MPRKDYGLGLERDNTTNTANSNRKSLNDAVDLSLQRPRSLASSIPTPDWSVKAPVGGLDISYSSPGYTTDRYQERLPSVHTLLGPLAAPSVSYNWPPYRSANGYTSSVEGASSAISAPSPMSTVPPDYRGPRKHTPQASPNLENWQASRKGSTHAADRIVQGQPPSSSHSSSVKHDRTSTSARPARSQPPHNDDGMSKARRTYASRKIIPRVYVYTKCLPGGDQIHVYDDGTECPAVSEGDVVNKYWGTTKAGKARKRKAQACLTCREKKIKCVQLNGATNSRCQACTRFDKACVYGSGSRSSESRSTGPPSPPTSSSHEDRSPSVETTRKASSSSQLFGADALVDDQSRKRRSLGQEFTFSRLPRTLEASTAVENTSMRSNRTHYQGTPVTLGTEGIMPERTIHRQQSSVGQSRGPLNLPVPSSFTLELDPFQVSPTLTSRLVDGYFFYRTSDVDAVLPQEQFKHWFTTCTQKTKSDKMLVYSLLALASVYDPATEVRDLGQHMASIAGHAERESLARPSLQLAQTRLNLCLYYFAEGLKEAAWEYAVMAQRVLLALGFHTERGILEFPDESLSFESGLTDAQMMECRRRTFWHGYLVSRMSGFCDEVGQSIHDADVFAQLPSSNEDFQAGSLRSETPHLGQFTRDRAQVLSQPPSDMALLVNIACIYGDISSFNQRSKHRPYANYSAQYDAFYRDVQNRLQLWDSSLPSQLQYSAENTHSNARVGAFTLYLGMQVARSACGIQLHLVGQPDQVSAAILQHNIQQAFHHATILLTLLLTFVKGDYQVHPSPDIQRALSQPFLASTVALACDVVSSGGPMEIMDQTREFLRAGSFVVGQCGRHWHMAKMQQGHMDDRLLQLASLEETRKDHWTILDPMEPAGDNKLYAVSPRFRLEAIMRFHSSTSGR